MHRTRRIFKLGLYPICFFAVLALIQYGIIWNAYSQQAERQLQPYMNNRPLPVLSVKIDRRPQSIDIPSFQPAQGPGMKAAPATQP